MEGQFEQLMLYYNQLKEMSKQLKILLDKESYNDAITMLHHRDRVIRELSLILRYLEMTEEQKSEVAAIKEEIRIQEDENIERLKKDMEDTKYELDVATSKAKFYHKYNPAESEMASGSVIDTRDT